MPECVPHRRMNKSSHSASSGLSCFVRVQMVGKGISSIIRMKSRNVVRGVEMSLRDKKNMYSRIRLKCFSNIRVMLFDAISIPVHNLQHYFLE